MSQEHILYISVGNTRTSFAFFKESINFKVVEKIETKELKNKDILTSIVTKLNITVSSVFVCSVVKWVDEIILEFFSNINIVFLTSANQSIINLDKIKNPWEIGADILASAIYSNTIGKEITVLSLGTATVIHHISDGSFIGCVISPGLEISYNSLIQNTSIEPFKLAEIFETNEIIGCDTKSAISIGVINAHKYMIESIANKFHNPETIYIYYGGNAIYLKLPNWQKIEDIDLLGLYIYSKSIF